MIGFAPPLPRFRNLDQYVSVVEHAIGRQLAPDEIVWAANARGGGLPAHRVAEWIQLSASPSTYPPGGAIPSPQDGVVGPLPVYANREGEEFRKERA